MKRVTIEDMRCHFTKLCDQEGPDFSVRTVNRCSKAYALQEAEEIGVPPIKSAISYATALHELGHQKGSHQRSKSVLVRERWAWQWARKTALLWTPQMERSAQRALAWYESKQD
jgi:hypothetical protein